MLRQRTGNDRPLSGKSARTAAISTTLRVPSSDLLKNDHFAVMGQISGQSLNVCGKLKDARFRPAHVNRVFRVHGLECPQREAQRRQRK